MASEKLQKKFQENLPEEWRNTTSGLTTDELRKLISETMHAESENQKNKENDLDVEQKRAALNSALEVYKTATKKNKLQMAYALWILEQKGGV